MMPAQPGDTDGKLLFELPRQFARQQGSIGWCYCASEAGTGATVLLSWQDTIGPAPNSEPCWTESSGVCIGETWLRPGAGRDAVLVWESQASGNAEIALTLQGRAVSGDGALASIWHNGTRITGPQAIPNSPQSQTIISTHAVAPGDRVALCVSPKGDYEADWFTYGARVTVTVR